VRITRTVSEVRAEVDSARRAGRPVAFVPTMGFLHEGHLSLARLARRHGEAGGASALVVLSIFVNPTQFGPNEDYAVYPRDLERDARLAGEAGVDVVFAPTVEEMYPPGFRTQVRVSGLTEPLCGAGRPGHFDGVALVVAKLLNIVRPDLTVFGQKDAQQSIVVRRLARDLDLPGEIVVGPIVREDDGVAMSSRNAYLSAQEREAARAIPRGLLSAALAYAAGERDPAVLRARVRSELDREDRLGEEYVEIVRRDDLGPWDGAGAALLAVAVRAGRTRLIDNVFLGEDAPPVPPDLAALAARGRAGGSE